MIALNLDQLKHDHQEIMNLMFDIIDTSERPTSEVVEDYFLQLRSLLSNHLEREDVAVYQRLMVQRSLIPAIEKARQDHHDIERLLLKLEAMMPGQSGWTETVLDAKVKLERHIAHEERELFPLLEEGGGVGENNR